MSAKLLNIVIFVTAVTGASALFEDQAFKFDWRQQLVGSVENVDFWDSASGSGVLVRTASNVLVPILPKITNIGLQICVTFYRCFMAGQVFCFMSQLF
jgi:hypothetical protein